MARNDAELLNAKRHLYHLLLGLTYEEFTDNEVKLAYFLAKDDQIQRFLGQHMDIVPDWRNA